jgi:hypothetical protein
MSKKISAAALAVAAAMVFNVAPLVTAHAADAAKVKCVGGNECKGKSACSGAKNACSGQNGCKGQGYVMLTPAECDAAKAKAKGNS